MSGRKRASDMRDEEKGQPLSGAHQFTDDTGDGPGLVGTLIRAENRNFPRKYYRSRNLEADQSQSPSDHIHVRTYYPPNWFTTRGVLLKRKQIEAKGLPSFFQWRFITLTIDQDLFESPLEAYKVGKDHMRRFMTAARKAGLWTIKAKWCWKMEFQKNGYPHWHLLVGRTQKFTEDQLKLIQKLWALGSTRTEMVRSDGFLYTFKYAFKPVRIDEDEDLIDDQSWAVPSWFLDYTGVKTVKVKCGDGTVYEASKPETFQRVRFWQTSAGFYTGKPPAKTELKVQVTWGVPQTVREMAERVDRSVQVIARDRLGKYMATALVTMNVVVHRLFHLASWHAIGGNAAYLRTDSVVLPSSILNQNTEQKWKLQPLLAKNRLSLRTAKNLQRRGETLARC